MHIGGTLVRAAPGQAKDHDRFDANCWKTGNGHLVFKLVSGLDASVVHLVEFEPWFADQDHKLRLESICVADEPATVEAAP